MTLARTLFQSTPYLRRKRDLVLSIKKAQEEIRGVKKGTSSHLLKELSKEAGDLRGRPLYYPALFSGLGRGPLVELVDGSIKYDFITGIGTHYFGHSDLDLISTAIEAASQNVVMQGNLQMGLEGTAYLKKLLTLAGPPLKYGWLALSGSFANDNALKIIRQKKSPAYKIIAFKNCFHGRTVMMAEITDNESYRKGLHRYHDVFYVPFFDPLDSQSIEKTVTAVKEVIQKHKEELCAFAFELIQGEGGFNEAPREFFVPLMELCKENGLAVWVDEVQTVGRTEELFAFQTLGLNTYVDIVTVGKLLQVCATLYTEAYNPDSGLVAGTFTGSSVSLAVAYQILERFEKEKFFGKSGKIVRLQKWVKKGLIELQQKVGKEILSDIRVVGAMVAFQYKEGSLEQTKEFILKLFDAGLMAFSCGRGPYKVRFLLPAGVLTESEFKKGLKILEKTL